MVLNSGKTSLSYQVVTQTSCSTACTCIRVCCAGNAGLAGGSAQQQYKPDFPSSDSDNIKEQFAFAAGLAAAGQVPLDTSEEQWWDQRAVTSPQDDSQLPPGTIDVYAQSQQGVESTPAVQVDVYQQQQPADQPQGNLSDQWSIQEAEKHMNLILAPSLYSEGTGRSMATEFQRTGDDSSSGSVTAEFQRSSEDSSSGKMTIEFQSTGEESSSVQQTPEFSQSLSGAQYSEPSASSSKAQSRSSSQQLENEQLAQQPQQSLVEVDLQVSESPQVFVLFASVMSTL